MWKTEGGKKKRGKRDGKEKERGKVKSDIDTHTEKTVSLQTLSNTRKAYIVHRVHTVHREKKERKKEKGKEKELIFSLFLLNSPHHCASISPQNSTTPHRHADSSSTHTHIQKKQKNKRSNGRHFQPSSTSYQRSHTRTHVCMHACTHSAPTALPYLLLVGFCLIDFDMRPALITSRFTLLFFSHPSLSPSLSLSFAQQHIHVPMKVTRTRFAS
jgi:hypothetical protein